MTGVGVDWVLAESVVLAGLWRASAASSVALLFLLPLLLCWSGWLRSSPSVRSVAAPVGSGGGTGGRCNEDLVEQPGAEVEEEDVQLHAGRA